MRTLIGSLSNRPAQNNSNPILGALLAISYLHKLTRLKAPGQVMGLHCLSSPHSVGAGTSVAMPAIRTSICIKTRSFLSLQCVMNGHR